MEILVTDTTDFAQHWKDYNSRLKVSLEKVPSDGIAEVAAVLRQARSNRKTIFFAGNGGSAATANHFACDLMKNTVDKDLPRYRCMSLSSSNTAITAYANDEGYETAFVEPMKAFFDEGDILLAVSASGNSPNIVAAAEYVLNHRGVVIGLSGFSGGKLKELANCSLHVPSDEYEVVEDAHSILLHALVCYAKRHTADRIAAQ
jgi:D-sedoheptulose 7-phosphate isomerase